MGLLRRVTLFSAIAFLFSCSDSTLISPEPGPDPSEPSMAKGGKKPKPSSDPVIREFWVEPGENPGDPDMLHLVVSDEVFSVNPSVVFDYFHNGMVDDDAPYDAHYEFYNFGPPSKEVTDLGNGWVHVDIPWDGRVSNLDTSPKFRDHLSIEYPGEGDPYAFFLPLKDRNGNTLDWARPRGVVVNGIETHQAELSLDDFGEPIMDIDGHSAHPNTVRSFATFEGKPANGFISLSAVGMKELQCKSRTVSSGRGKDKVTTKQYQLSALITVGVAGAPSEDHIWWEGHFWVVGTDILSRRMTSMAQPMDAPASLNMPAEWDGSGEVEFVVDYLYSAEPTWDFVYDPFKNVPPTTAGFSEDPFTERTGLIDGMAVPVAHSGRFGSGCS